MLKKAAAVLLVCAGIAIGTGCTTTSSRYLFAAIPASNELVAFREDPNSGVLTELSISPITAGPGVQSILIHPKKAFMYAANSGEGDISLFKISSQGSLTEVTPRTNAGTVPTVLAMDSSGSYLYVGNSGSFDISVFSINSTTGALTQVGSNVPVGLSPMNMALSPSGNFLYVTGEGGSQGYIEAFKVNQGVLTAVTPVSVFFTGNDPFGLAIDSSGTHLYTGNKLDNSISEFTINGDGSLTALQNSPIGEAFVAPVSLLINKNGKYLYVANQGSTNLSAFTIDSSGGLTLLASSPFATGSNPTFLASDVSGNFLFVGTQGGSGTGQTSSSGVQSFTLDANSGTLVEVANYTVPGTATSIAITP